MIDLTTAEQERLTKLLVYGATVWLHYACIRDAVKAWSSGDWLEFFRQFMIEAILALLTFLAFITDCSRRFF